MRTKRQREASGTVRHDDGRIIIDLPLDEAEWLANMVYPDGLATDLYVAIEEAEIHIAEVT